ncbi:MAG: hypothetical protein GY753_09680 [Gammaproteobacteria bacterium]|nr:hypothetical protein [Gammaproteobacteria bacterium]
MTTLNNENWTIACGGKEPVMTIDGKRYQYQWEQISGIHAYYCFEDDMFLVGDLADRLPGCLRT